MARKSSNFVDRWILCINLLRKFAWVIGRVGSVISNMTGSGHVKYVYSQVADKARVIGTVTTGDKGGGPVYLPWNHHMNVSHSNTVWLGYISFMLIIVGLWGGVNTGE